MTERERWIVYPLLLLGLGASLKDKLVSPSVLKAEKIECNSLQCRQQLAAGQVAAGQMVVVDPQRQPKILLRAIPARQGNTVLKGKTQGQISLFDESNQLMCAVGQPIVCTQLVAVGPVEIAGGWLRLYDRAGKLKAQLRSAEPGQLGADQAAEPQSGGVTSGRFELYGADPTSIVTMGALEQGGFVTVSRNEQPAHVLLNHNAFGSGLFAVDAAGLVRPLAVVPPPGGPSDPAGDSERGEAEEGEAGSGD